MFRLKLSKMRKRVFCLALIALTALTATATPRAATAQAGSAVVAGHWYQHDGAYERFKSGRTYYDFIYTPISNNTAIINKYIGDGGFAVIPAKIGPYTVTGIDAYAFRGADCISVTIPDTVKVIGYAAFEYCSFQNVWIPDSVERIGDYAFTKSDLVNVVIGNGLKSISDLAFIECKSLENVRFGDAVKEVGSYAFAGITYGRDILITIYGDEDQSFARKWAEDNGYEYVVGYPVGPQAEPGMPSGAVRDDVAESIKRRFVPAHLQNNYQQPITYAELCALAVQRYELGGIYTPIKARGAAFDTTSDINIQKIKSLGVAIATRNGYYSPDVIITREQAAVFVSNYFTVYMNYDFALKNMAPYYKDTEDVSSWAKYAVGQMQLSGLIRGTGFNSFSPQEAFTREEAMSTFYRLNTAGMLYIADFAWVVPLGK